jgi:hypothetical protein
MVSSLLAATKAWTEPSREVIDNALAATVVIKTDANATGAGFLVSPKGHLITSSH